MSYLFGDVLRARIAGHLQAFPHQRSEDTALRKAAVVIVIAETIGDGAFPDGQACVLLTRRSAHLRRHAGQFALPGGRLDEGETLEQAALRELHEELRLELQPDAILGTLDDYPTRSGFAITPIVAWGGPARDIVPDPGEVALLHRIPLTDLDNPDIPHLEPKGEGQPPVMSAPLATLGHRIYAPTAALLYQFREVAMHGRPTRVAHFDQPKFAWR
jgi:8-oxo-dGTP pyrophosphatase MutT (NUDIX family)